MKIAVSAAERLAIFTDDSNLGHALAIIRNNRLECYEIGKLTLENLDVQA